MKKYYLDTAIWIDLYEDRKGFDKEPLGDFAWELLSSILANNNKIILSDFIIKELEAKYSLEQINGLFRPFKDVLIKVFLTKKQKDEAKKLIKNRNLPKGDAIHAIIARDNKAVLITRDKHFAELESISKYFKPEDVI